MIRRTVGRPKEYKSRETLTTCFEHDLLSQFKKECHKEGKSINDILKSLIEDYLTKHINGNPAFKIDQWVDNPNMMAVPAVFAKDEEIGSYQDSLNESELSKLTKQLDSSWIKHNNRRFRELHDI